MTRIGFAQGYSPKLNVREMADFVQQADERGYEMGFFSETIEVMRDSVSAMAAFALATKRINIGCTQIVRLRTPIIHAQTVATIDELSEGRFILAPGACTRTHAVWNSLEPEDPVGSLKGLRRGHPQVPPGREADCLGRGNHQAGPGRAGVEALPGARSHVGGGHEQDRIEACRRDRRWRHAQRDHFA